MNVSSVRARPIPSRTQLTIPESTPGKRRPSASPTTQPPAQRPRVDPPLAQARTPGTPLNKGKRKERPSPESPSPPSKTGRLRTVTNSPEPLSNSNIASTSGINEPINTSEALPPPRFSLRAGASICDLTSVEADPIAPELADRVFLDTLLPILRSDDELLKRLVRVGLTGTRDELERGILSFLESIFPSARRTRQRRRDDASQQRRPPPPPKPSTASARRAAVFKKCQDLFKRKRSTLAQKLIEGTPIDTPDTTPNIETLEAYYRNIFCAEAIRDDAPFTPLFAKPTHAPITEAEIATLLGSWNNSAPGPDGITICQIKRCAPRNLSTLFTVLLYRRHTPQCWRQNRTVMVPKEGDLADPSNWRPITIGSALQRLLHRILQKRIALAVDLHESQRGFRECDGMLANLLTLEHYIKSRRLQGKAYNVVSLDIRKAFDSVSHASIVRALRRSGLDDATCEYIQGTLNAHTNISMGSSQSRDIRFQRGVKQGDPLSPLLFNLVMDELLRELNSTRPGGTLDGNGTKLCALAFADDIVLFEDRDIDMSVTLDITQRFLADRGMTLNPKKCVSIAATTIHGKSVPRTRAIFRVAGEAIRSLTTYQTFRYLGLHFSSAGSCKPTLFNLTTWLNNVARSPLKPFQKYTLIRDYLIPRMYHGLQTPSITANTLSECDRLIRKTIKRILHLSEKTGSQFLHARIREGGLGIPQLRHKIPHIMLGRVLRERANDPILDGILQTEPSLNFHQRLTRLGAKGNPDPYWREQIATRAFSRGIESAAEDSSSRYWLTNPPKCWSGRDFVRAVHLRTNALPCKGLPTVPRPDRWCRAGCKRIESLSHILQGCKVTHFERIKRHNEVVNKIARHTRRKGWQTDVEPRIRHQEGQLFIPDLVVHQDQRIVVADAQICWEGPRTLAESWTRKQQVYDNIRFREAAARIWPGKELVFLPILLGARGIWPRANAGTAAALEIPNHLKGSCVSTCLKWGSTIHRHFMSSVWRRMDRGNP